MNNEIPQHIKDKIEDRYSVIRCSDTNFRLKLAAEFGYGLASPEIEQSKSAYESLTSQFEYLADKVIKKDAEIERLEKEDSITESQLIIANQEIERLKAAYPLPQVTAGSAWANHIKQFEKLDNFWQSLPEVTRLWLSQQIDIFAGKYPQVTESEVELWREVVDTMSISMSEEDFNDTVSKLKHLSIKRNQ